MTDTIQTYTRVQLREMGEYHERTLTFLTNAVRVSAIQGKNKYTHSTTVTDELLLSHVVTSLRNVFIDSEIHLVRKDNAMYEIVIDWSPVPTTDIMIAPPERSATAVIPDRR